MIWIRQKWFWFLILAVSGTSIAYYVNKSDFFPGQIRGFQQTFREKEIGLTKFLEEKKKLLTLPWTEDNIIIDTGNDYTLHFYRNDSLIYWNSNNLPVGRFADIHYPANGLVHLQNGWYFTKSLRKANKTICAAFLIKTDYPYENADLRNEFQSQFKLDKHTMISLNQDDGFHINDQNGRFLFSLVPSSVQEESGMISQLMLFFYLVIFSFWMCLILLLFKNINSHVKWILPILLILFKCVALHYGLFQFKIGEGALDPTVYAASKWFPNYFEFLTNIIAILFILKMLEDEIQKLSARRIIACILLSLTTLFWIPLRELTEGLVENSSIPLSIDRLFSLNGYTVLAIVSSGALLLMLYRFIVATVRYWIRCSLHPKWAYILSSTVFAGIFISSGIVDRETVVPDVLAFLFVISILYKSFQKKSKTPLPISLLILTFGTLCLTSLIFIHNERREKTIQELYAQKLANEQSIATELEYPRIINKITSDPVLTRLNRGNEFALSASEFEDGLERRIFNGFWEQYELDFFLFDTLGNLLISEGEDLEEDWCEKFNDLIEKHGQQSQIDGHIYFIRDHTEQYNYIFRQELFSASNEKRVFIVTLKSKKIPEEIGFPRLLISGNSQALQYLEKYSIAKYHQGRLVISYGAFNFPYRFDAIKSWRREGNFRIKDNFRHAILRTDLNNVSVLSSEQADIFSFISSFSYLFIFFGAFLIPSFFRFIQLPLLKRSLPLSTRIQIILLGIVFVSIVAFGWGSSSFIKRQYDTFSTNMIADKLRSMALEINGKLRNRDKLSLEKHGNTMQSALEKIARIYRTDANLYDEHGVMIASSRPKIYRLGLVGDQMNRRALSALRIQKKSRYIQEEHIGNLKFASAYMPCFNKDGRLIGFFNLQYFSQQRELEEQIETFIVSLINIFMFLFALSLVTTLFISNWLTAPLRLLKDNLSRLKLGRIQEPIHYSMDDEIGDLVAAYNSKLEELDFTAAQLAKSERESAWKEMAKQVAHEIKNPLTPMKLSVQQLERSFDPADPQSSEKLRRVSSSLIEQIDALTHIANEFSSFAQMPPPNESIINLVELINNIVQVFQETTEGGIILSSSQKEILIRADKDQIVRVFNNLLKNAVQAKSPDRKLRVQITIQELEEGRIIISVSDNGIGITFQEQNKIFTPHFTTKSTGSGLGLAMVKQIIENHNGNITFESIPETGTTFKITLPKI